MNNIVYKSIVGILALLLILSIGYLTYYLLNKDDDLPPIEQLTSEEKAEIYNLIISGNINEYEKFLNDGKKLSFAFSDGTTPIEKLLANNDVISADKLLKSGFDLSLVDNSISTIINIMEIKQQLDIQLVDEINIKLVSQIKANIDEPDERGNSLLINGIYYNNIKVVEEVLKHTKNLNVLYNGQTAITYATQRQGTSIEIIELLINAGSDINSTDVDGWTPLMNIVWQSNEDKLDLLLTNSKLNLNIQNNDLDTALHLAVKYNKFNSSSLITKLVGSSGINKNIKNRDQQTAKDLAISLGLNNLALLL